MNNNYSENCMPDCDEMYCDTCHAQITEKKQYDEIPGTIPGSNQEIENVEIRKIVALMKFFQQFNLSKEAYEVLGDALTEQSRMLKELNNIFIKHEDDKK